MYVRDGNQDSNFQGQASAAARHGDGTYVVIKGPHVRSVLELNTGVERPKVKEVAEIVKEDDPMDYEHLIGRVGI